MATDEAGLVLCAELATRRYQHILALDRVSLSVAGGEVYALIGRNGAGKSTLAKAAIGALALDAGSIRVNGQDPSRNAAARLRIGIAPQEIALWDHLTIEENVTAFAALAGVPRPGRAKAVDAALDAASCAEGRRQRVSSLSGGWRRRANLAAAIVHGPDLLVLDEPTEGLDAAMRMSLHGLVRQLRSDGVAILLISHDQETVVGLADRLGVLVEGRLAAEGAPERLEAQAFGPRRQVTVRSLGGSDRAADLFKSSGLSFQETGVWSGLIEDGIDRARQLEQDLMSIGAQMKELQISRPGLDGLIDWAARQEQP